jgi:hypothetical protein
MRPEVPSQQVRKYTYVYAAVAPEPGIMTDKERLQSMTCFPHFRIDI